MRQFRVTLGSVIRVVSESDVWLVADELAKGGGVPKIETIQEPVVPSVVPAIAPIVYSNFGDGNQTVDVAAKARIETLHTTLIESGVKVDTKEQYFETGTRMAKIGYETQEQRKKEHEKKMRARDACDELIARVRDEQRRDITVRADSFADGLGITIDPEGICTAKAYGTFAMSEHALRGLLSRLESPALSYVLGLQSRLTKGDAEKMIDVIQYECRKSPTTEIVLRTRETIGDCYAVVSPQYAIADAPTVLPRIERELPLGARGSFAYNPDTTAWEIRAQIWTPTPTLEQAVGEPFEGYVSLSARDNGTSRFRGGGGVTMIRCLNASTYVAENKISSRVHRGKTTHYDIDAMLRSALNGITVLASAWGMAREQIVDPPSKVKINDILPGIWRDMLTRKSSELCGVLSGRTEENVERLTQAYWSERRDQSGNVTRSDLGQAWTKHIQSLPDRREAEQAIGQWIVNRGTVGYTPRA